MLIGEKMEEKELTPEIKKARADFEESLRLKQESFLNSQGACGGKYSKQDPSNGIYYCENDRSGHCPNRGRIMGPGGSSERVPYCTFKTGR